MILVVLRLKILPTMECRVQIPQTTFALRRLLVLHRYKWVLVLFLTTDMMGKFKVLQTFLLSLAYTYGSHGTKAMCKWPETFLSMI